MRTQFDYLALTRPAEDSLAFWSLMNSWFWGNVSERHLAYRGDT
jgi:hypothetical protein